jgi:hypothetical protein
MTFERDWHAIAKLYVFGMVVKVRDDGSEVRGFPTIRQIEHVMAIPRSVIGYRARREDWVGRRLKFRAQLGDATWQELAERELARRPGADPR